MTPGAIAKLTGDAVEKATKSLKRPLDSPHRFERLAGGNPKNPKRCTFNHGKAAKCYMNHENIEEQSPPHAHHGGWVPGTTTCS